MKNIHKHFLIKSILIGIVVVFMGGGYARAASEYSTDSNLRTNQGIVNAAQLDAFIRAVHPDSPLLGHSQMWIDTANKYGLDPVYLMSHAILESGWGYSDIARDKKNLYGWSAFDSDPYGYATAFPSFEVCTDYVAGQILASYLTPGGEYYNGPTLAGMSLNYASAGMSWANSINNIMNLFASGWSTYHWPGVPGYTYPGLWSMPDWFWRYGDASGFGQTQGTYAWPEGYIGDRVIMGAFDGAKPDGVHKRKTLAVYRGAGIYPNWRRFWTSPSDPFDLAWGDSSFTPFVGDFNGDGLDDIALYRSGAYPNWFIKLSTGIGFSPDTYTYSFGNPGDTPLVGDFDGNGRDDIAIYRAGGYPNWYIMHSLPSGGMGVDMGNIQGVSFGNPSGDEPFVGDFDNDKAVDIGVRRPGANNWYVLKSRMGVFDGSVISTTWGNMYGDMTLIGDFNGDGRADIGIYRTTGYPNWFAKYTTPGGDFGAGTDSSLSWGNLGMNDTPFVGDFSADGIADIGILRMPLQ